MHLTLDALPINCVLVHHNIYSGFGAGSPTGQINGYTHNTTLTSGDSVPLGSQVILVCRIGGLPNGTVVNYTWTCPKGPCEVKGYYGRKVYNEHILAVNITSTSDGGTYTCQMTATGGQEATGNFTLSVMGVCAIYSCTIVNMSTSNV